MVLETNNIRMDLLKIGTLNLCLGLKFKKDIIKTLMLNEEIDILLMQEIELEEDFDCELVNIPGFNFECEMNNNKRRVGIYVKDSIKYTRCLNLEGQNSHLIIVDLEDDDTRNKTML